MIALVFVSLFVSITFSQSKNIKISVPSGLSYKGELLASNSWTDKNGTNYIVISRTKAVVTKKVNAQLNEYSQYFFAYHYVKTGSTFKLIRKISDNVQDCPLQIKVKYVEGSLTVTDLDNNAYKEVSFVYQKSCSGDMSPDDMKLMLLENGKKYPVRGTTQLDSNDGLHQGGTKTFGYEFDSAPASFKTFATKQWNKFKKHSF